MNTVRTLFLLIPLTFILYGCNTTDTQDEVTTPPKNVPVEDGKRNNGRNTDVDEHSATRNDDRTEQENTKLQSPDENHDYLFDFSVFKLEVDYDGHLEYEVSYENHHDEMEAEIEDTINNEKVRGDDAFKQLLPIFESLNISKDTPKDEVITKVLRAFDLRTDYSRFELEVTFEDGTKKEYEDPGNINTST